MKRSFGLLLLGFVLLGTCSAAQVIRGVDGQSRTFASSQRAGDKLALGDMERSLMKVASVGSGTPVKDLVDVVKPHIDNMQTRILGAHNSAQSSLNAFGTTFSGCSSNKSTGDTANQGLLTIMNGKKQTHTTCRNGEGTKETAYGVCSATLAADKTTMDNKCDAYENEKIAPNLNLLPAPNNNEEYEPWLVRVQDDVERRLNTLRQKDELCTNATSDYTAQKKICEGPSGSGGLKKAWEDKKIECDQAQTELETSACTYYAGVDSTCSSYGTCAETARGLYNGQKSNFEAEETDRKAEWRATMRIECMLGVFGNAEGNNVNRDKIQECVSKTHSTANLDLVYPTPPPDPLPPCLLPEHPCTNAYVLATYGTLPSNAPHKECTPCGGGGGSTTQQPTTSPTQWNPPTNLVFKSQSNAHNMNMNADFPLAGTGWCSQLGRSKAGTPCYTPKDYNSGDPAWYSAAVGFYFVLMVNQPRTIAGIDVVLRDEWFRPTKLRAGCMADGRSSLVSSPSGTGFFMHDAPFENVAPNLQTERVYATLNGTQFMQVLYACCASNTPPCGVHPDTRTSCPGVDKHTMIFDTPITCNVGEKFFVMSGSVCDYRNGAMCYYKGWGMTGLFFTPVPLVAR